MNFKFIFSVFILAFHGAVKAILIEEIEKEGAINTAPLEVTEIKKLLTLHYLK